MEGAGGVAESYREKERKRRVTTARVGKAGSGEEEGVAKWKNLRFSAREERPCGEREFASVGVTLDKRRGLYVVLTPRLSTGKQPLSPTYWKPPWTSVTTIVAKHT